MNSNRMLRWFIGGFLKLVGGLYYSNVVEIHRKDLSRQIAKRNNNEPSLFDKRGGDRETSIEDLIRQFESIKGRSLTDVQYLLFMVAEYPVKSCPIVKDYLENRLRYRPSKRRDLQMYLRDFYAEVANVDNLSATERRAVTEMVSWLSGGSC